MRGGTSLQENVSEIFARVAVIFMYEVKEKDVAPICLEDIVKNYSNKKPVSRLEGNALDLHIALNSFSEESQMQFISQSGELLKRVAHLYGCEL